MDTALARKGASCSSVHLILLITYTVRKGTESTHKRNQRRKRVQTQFQRKMKTQDLKLKAYHQRLTLPRKPFRFGCRKSAVRILPEFQCDDVPLLPEGAVLPLTNSSETMQITYVYVHDTVIAFHALYYGLSIA